MNLVLVQDIDVDIIVFKFLNVGVGVVEPVSANAKGVAEGSVASRNCSLDPEVFLNKKQGFLLKIFFLLTKTT